VARILASRRTNVGTRPRLNVLFCARFVPFSATKRLLPESFRTEVLCFAAWIEVIFITKFGSTEKSKPKLFSARLSINQFFY